MLCEDRYNSSYTECATTVGPDTKSTVSVPSNAPKLTPREFVFIQSSERSTCSGAASQQQANSPRQGPHPVVFAAPHSRQHVDYSWSHRCVFKVHSVPDIVLGAGDTVQSGPPEVYSLEQTMTKLNK